MNPSEADATKLAQEAAALTKRSELISREADRFAEMARKVGGKTRPAIRLMAESDRLKAEANDLRAQAEQLQTQFNDLLPVAEIVGSPAVIKPVLEKTNQNVVDVEPLAPPPRPSAARIVVPIPKPPVATEKWGPGMKPTTEVFKPAPEILKPAAKPIVEPVKPVQQVARPEATIANPLAPKSEVLKPEPPKTETPSPVLREVNRVHERFPDKSQSAQKPPPSQSPAKTTPPKAGFFKRILSFGKSAERPPKPAPAIARTTASAVKSSVPPAKPVEPMFETPKATPAPSLAAAIPAPPRVEKPTPAIATPTPPPPAPTPVAPIPVTPTVQDRFVTCHCPKCDQGVEFDSVELTPDNCLIPCPNCGEEMKLSIT